MALRVIDHIHVASAPLADVPDDRLSPEERELASRALRPERKLERRAGRAAARQALESLLKRATFAVVADEQGRPKIEGASACVSIAHSDALVVAAASFDPVGIDIEPFSRAERLDNVVSTLLSRGRAVGLEGNAGAWPEAMLLWTAWEALGKLDTTGVLGGAMKRPIRITSQHSAKEDAESLSATGLSATSPSGTSVARRLRWWRLEGHVCCLAW